MSLRDSSETFGTSAVGQQRCPRVSPPQSRRLVAVEFRSCGAEVCAAPRCPSKEIHSNEHSRRDILGTLARSRDLRQSGVAFSPGAVNSSSDRRLGRAMAYPRPTAGSVKPPGRPSRTRSAPRSTWRPP